MGENNRMFRLDSESLPERAKRYAFTDKMRDNPLLPSCSFIKTKFAMTAWLPQTSRCLARVSVLGWSEFERITKQTNKR